MAIAITDDHRRIAEAVDDILTGNAARAATRALLEAPDPADKPKVVAEIAGAGLLGVHLPERHGGAGYGLPELVVVLEQLGRHVAPGPLLPTLSASAVVADLGAASLAARVLPGLADGSRSGALGTADGVTLTDRGGRTLATGRTAVLGGAGADVLVLAAGADLVLLDAYRDGVTLDVPQGLDPARPSARVSLAEVTVEPDEIVRGGRGRALALYRLLAAAEAVGGAGACTDMAVAYARTREQFGRTIGTFQAVQHHCADMFVAAELAVAAVWDAARAADDTPERFALAAATAAHQAIRAFTGNASLNIQVHGGIGFTWEHDAHLYQRRALSLSAFVDPAGAACDLVELVDAGTVRAPAPEIPPQAEAQRPAIREVARSIAARPTAQQRGALVDTGYLTPHWPEPFGISATAAQQLVIDEELAAAGVERPVLSITGWVLLTIVQHGTPDQVERFVRRGLAGDLVWCQLFSEPGAGSDAAGIRTRGRRVDGGWVVTGQKVWTSGAHRAGRGLATVRTDPDAPKHRGVTTMIIDMGAPGVRVRPLQMVTGHSEFNEVFLDEVFVPEADVLGAPNDGWTVARATMGNERVSIGGGHGGGTIDLDLATLGRRAPGGTAAVAHRLGPLLAEQQALNVLNLRGAERALAGAAPGPEGNVTKLVLAEFLVRRGEFAMSVLGPDGAFVEPGSQAVVQAALAARGMTIAGGTSEITRNQIAQRILGLPRDPLVR